MTSPSNADLREAIVIKLNSMFGQNYVETEEGTLFTTEIADELLPVFQAREQQILTEFLGEAIKYRLADGSPEPAVPVSVIEARMKKDYVIGVDFAHPDQNKTNDGGSDE